MRPPMPLDRLREDLESMESVVVAFSGGVDSAFLASVAHETLGPDRARAVTAVSPSLAAAEWEAAAALADEWGLRWTTVETDEMTSAAYRANDPDRCSHCKEALMDAVGPMADAEGSTVLLGVTLDDMGDHRPGQQAAASRGARFPLLDAGFTKAEVREQSRLMGLRTWDKPAGPCLASRVPYGSPVSVSVLSTVERAEAGLHRLGFDELRVRHYGDTARIEVPEHRLSEVVVQRSEVVAAVSAAGYRHVTLDLAGLRSGNLNDVLRSDP
ncbi:MAG: ATP-dependent sacrificial sulfur transferase LarE [Actinobacteria bacterium]|nr:ATP-dependent sacrificial sulfur transferase LarE [Actinomycetota bacterium]